MKQKLSIIYWYVFLVVYLEIIYKIFVWNTYFDKNLIIIIFFSIPFALFFYFINNVWHPLANKVLNIIWSFLIILIFVAQYIYYEFYKSIFSIMSAKMGTGQVFGEFFDAIWDYIIRNYKVIILMLLPFIVYLIFKNKIFEFKRNTFKYNFIILSIFLLLYLGNLIYIKTNNKEIYSEYKLYYKVHAPMLTINKFGLLTMEKLDLKRYVFGFEEDMLAVKQNVTNIEEEKYNMININFDELIKNESDEVIKNMHMYFNNEEHSKKNEYTGLFKGKNLILITAESLDISAIRKDTTPTLYKMLNNSFVFNNFYQPLYPVSTSDGEYMALTSLLPKEGIWSFYKSSNINMPYGLGNVFNKLGYTTKAYHNHSYNYYNRELSHPNLGFDFIGCGNGLEKKINCEIWPESDLEMIEATTSDYIKSSNFVSYYMSVSGHLRYNLYNSMSIKNWDVVKNLPYKETIKAYLAANIELDKALESLLKSLEENDKLKDTLIVIVPDHYPYGLTIKELNEISENDRSDKFELYHTSLIMYNSQLEKKVINDYISSIDILPTIFNLYGIEYDSRLLMGRDIFSDSEKIVVLSDRSWITNKGKYDSISEKFVPFNKNVSNEYINEINDKVYQKFNISSYILDKNYYSYLGDL